MNGLNARRSIMGRTILSLALMALVMRAFIPTGTMLERDAETGALVLSLCLADGSVSETVIDLDLGDDADHDQPDMRGGCPFAAASAPVLPTPDAVSFVPVLIADAIALDTAQHVSLTSISRPPLPARGPPTHT